MPPPLSLSTKDVHGMWITMWMSEQYHAVPEHLTHCPIGRQHNPCNFTEMHFFAETRIGGQHRSYAISSLFYGRALRSVQTDRAKFTRDSREKQDERNGGEFEVYGTSSRACRARRARRALERLAGYHEWLIVRCVRYSPTVLPSESMHESSSRRFPVAVPTSMFSGRPRP